MGAGPRLMRLLCDEMLARLGRWLRAAGYDTAIAEDGLGDAALIARCMAEDRVLVTRDRHLAAQAQDRTPVLRLDKDGLDAQATALREALGVDWQSAPFSRCVVDNAPLEAAPPDAIAQVPPTSRAALQAPPGGLPGAAALRRCPCCGRLYWPGGHLRRMQLKLAAWAGRSGI